jgi:hypothetical protein
MGAGRAARASVTETPSPGGGARGSERGAHGQERLQVLARVELSARIGDRRIVGAQPGCGELDHEGRVEGGHELVRREHDDTRLLEVVGQRRQFALGTAVRKAEDGRE